MFNFVMPALTAMGINSGMNLLRRKPLFENTGTAAVTGGVLGGFGQPGGIFGSTPVQTAGAASNTIVPGSIESVMGAAGADGVFRNPEYFANVLGSPVYTGNEGLLSQIGTGAESLFDTAKANLPDITPQNLLGVSTLLSTMNNMPRPVASNMGGGQITGTPPKFEPFQTGQVYTRKRGNR
jgi:hypothetical protein